MNGFMNLLSQRERNGPIAQGWEGEGLCPLRRSPSSPHALTRAGPFFSLWEKTK